MNNDHSTEPDKCTGWQKRDLTPQLKQFPLIFINPSADILSKSLTTFGNNFNYRVVYMGPRFTSNMKAFKSYSYNEEQQIIRDSQVYGVSDIQKYSFRYGHQKQKFFPIRVSEYRLFTGTNPTMRKDDLRFDSNFQCGNLDLAIYVNPAQYDLLMRVDSNTKGHTAWYYFKVSNVVAKQKIKFNIINYGKKYLLYKDGMKPYVFKQSTGKWVQQAVSVSYCKRRFRYEGAQSYLKQSLSFIYEFKSDENVYFAYCIPYSYSYLLHRINHFKQKYSHLMKIKYNYQSTGGLPVPLLTITNSGSSKEDNKPSILCVARQHPGETQGSWMIDGFIDYLLSPEGHYLREKNVFEIIPMLNVDGVILGNFRTGIMGRDLNRCFHLKKKYNQIDLLRLVAQQRNPFIFLDFHGHSAKRNVFIYGPDFKIQDKNYLKCRIFPKLISKITPVFRYYSCLFKINSTKDTTGRAIMLRQFNVDFSYTIQASTYAYGPLKQTQTFSGKQYLLMGKNICSALVNFNRFIRMLPQRLLNKQKKLLEQQNKKNAQKDRNLDQNKTHKGLLQSINNMDDLTVLDKQILREILQDQQTLQFDKQDEDQQSDSDCEGEENDYTAKEMENIISPLIQEKSKSPKKTKKRKKQSKSKQSKDKKNKSQIKKNDIFLSKPSKNFLESNKSVKKSKKYLKSEEQCELRSSKTIDLMEKNMVNRFEERTSNILTKNPSYMDNIIQKKKLRPSGGDYLPSLQSIDDTDEKINGLNIDWRQQNSSSHFIFDQSSLPSNPIKAKGYQAFRSPQIKKNPLLSIRKSILPMVGRSCETLDHSNHEKSMLSQILEHHQKRKKLSRNVRIIFL